MEKTFTWTPYSWKSYLAMQQPVYPNIDAFNQVIEQIKKFNIVTSTTKIQKLIKLLKDVNAGKSLIIQAGDCAESFAEFSEDRVIEFAKLLTKMQQTVAKNANKNVIKIGRIAGQFAKPRSASTELVNSQALPVYRGDIINSLEYSVEARTADPKRMIQAYKQAQQTATILNKLDHKLVNYNHEYDTSFISHEALLLPYEQAFIRYSDSINWYSGAADSLWIGKRTAFPKSAHVEMLKGVVNPIAIKVCSNITTEAVINIINKINPLNLTAKVMLIVRMGKYISKQLPKLIQAIARAQKSVIWLTDPMHANTYKTATGYKTRCLTSIYTEIEHFLKIMYQYNYPVGGIHLEVSPEQVTECIDGNNISKAQLSLNYKSSCDPRLNPQQALAVCNFFANSLYKYQTNVTTQMANENT